MDEKDTKEQGSKGLAVGAYHFKQRQLFCFILRGSRNDRQRVDCFEFSSQPLQDSSRDERCFVHGCKLTEEQIKDEHNATVIVVRVVAYSGNLWCRPVESVAVESVAVESEDKYKPVPCDWLHGYKANDESQGVFITQSINGWIKMSDKD